MHQLKSERYIVNLLIEIFWREEELVERDKVSLEKTHDENKIHPIMKLIVQIRHFQVYLVQLFVYERNQGLLDNLNSTTHSNESGC